MSMSAITNVSNLCNAFKDYITAYNSKEATPYRKSSVGSHSVMCSSVPQSTCSYLKPFLSLLQLFNLCISHHFANRLGSLKDHVSLQASVLSQFSVPSIVQIRF